VTHQLQVAVRDGFGHERPGEGITNDWLTPPRLVEMLGSFELDPCGCPTSPWQLAARQICPPQDGLSLPWEGRVFCNPPYGPHVGKWAEKMAQHGNGILLIFSRLETDPWQVVWRGDAFLFLHGRIAFFRADGSRAKKRNCPKHADCLWR